MREALAGAARLLADAGLRGSFLVRDLDSGDELGLEADRVWPVASLAKLPLAVAVLQLVHQGRLDATARVEVAPGRMDPGPPGLSRFRHAAVVAVDDLLYLSTSLSDSVAADLLLELVPPPVAAAALGRIGVSGLTLRHPFGDLMRTPVERLEHGEAHLGHVLAATAGTDGRGHELAQLDVARANTGSARAYVDLLHEVWRPRALPVPVARRVRELMAASVHRQRLAPDFESDAASWSSKTATVLNLRHEVGVVEHADGTTFAVAALTESSVAATRQPAAEATIGEAARRLRDALRLT